MILSISFYFLENVSMDHTEDAVLRKRKTHKLKQMNNLLWILGHKLLFNWELFFYAHYRTHDKKSGSKVTEEICFDDLEWRQTTKDKSLHEGQSRFN